MTGKALLVQFLVEVLAVGAIFAVLPRITRRGLLFGVYVGVEGWSTDEARAVNAAWYRSMLLVTAGSVAVFLSVARIGSWAGAFVAGSLMLYAGAAIVYVRAHRAARRLAVEGVPPAVSLLEEEPPSATLVPLLAISLVVLAALAMTAYAWKNYPAMPERIPVHFDLAGLPDGWARKSLVQILLLPALTLLLGSFLSVLALLLPHAKRGLRYPGTSGSAEAGRRFRLAIGRFLCAMALAVTGWMAVIHIGQVRAALGQSAGLGPLALIVGLGITALALGGMIYLMARYGQAGARLEEAGGAATGELTDGLADNRLWKWGLLYVNREDPSIFVEKRFGFGYTINFGNPKAVALFGGFFLVLFALVLVAVVTG